MVTTSRLQPPEGTPFYWLIVTAGSGEANTMTVTALGNGLAIRDSTAPVQVADPNCTATSLYEATCSPPARFERVKVDLGDRDDALLVAAPLPTELSGGSGNDRLGYQGAFGALMQGDAGDDVLEGETAPTSSWAARPPTPCEGRAATISCTSTASCRTTTWWTAGPAATTWSTTSAGTWWSTCSRELAAARGSAIASPESKGW